MGKEANYIGALIRQSRKEMRQIGRRLPSLGGQDLALAELRLQDLTKDCRDLEREHCRLEDEEQTRADLQKRARLDINDRLNREEGMFWFRRFFTTLAIANAVGIAALGNAFLQAEDRVLMARLTVPGMTLFAWGLTMAGLVPIILGAQSYLQTRLRVLIKMTRELIPPPLIRRVALNVRWLMGAVTVGLILGSTFFLAWGLFHIIGVLNAYANRPVG